MKINVYIQDITPFNYPLIYIMNLFCNIHYWKYKGISEKLVVNFHKIFFDEAETLYILKEKSWLASKEIFFKEYESIINNLPQNKKNFVISIMQTHSIQFEDYYFFSELSKIDAIEKKRNKVFYVPNISWFKFKNHYHFKFRRILHLNILLELLYEKAMLLGKVIKFRPHLLSKQLFSSREFKCIIDDLSPLDFSLEDGKRDLLWMVKNQLISLDETLFIIPSNLPQQIIERYNKIGLNMIRSEDLVSCLTRKDRFYLLVSYIILPFKFIFDINLWRLPLWKIIVNSSWHAPFFKQFKIKIHISTNSSLWPEPQALGYCKNLGIKTVKWFYSSNEFIFSRNKRRVNDLQIRGSIIGSDYLWLWNNDVLELLQNRNFNKLLSFPEPNYRVIGPLMQGDFSYLEKSKKKLRQELNIDSNNKIFISLFDVPILNDKILRQHNHMTASSLNSQKLLFQLGKELVDKFPEVILIYKPKKKSSNDRSNNSSIINEIFGNNSNLIKEQKVILLSYDIDPFLPILIADICMANPMSSPLMIAHDLGIPYFYFDPECRATSFANFLHVNSIFTNKNDIFTFVKNYIKNHNLDNNETHEAKYLSIKHNLSKAIAELN